MNKLKVLWLSNKALSDEDRGATGTWLEALAFELAASGRVELANISRGPVSRMARQELGSIRQWVIPQAIEPILRSGRLNLRATAAVSAAVKEFSPHLIHVWGTEGFWGLLTARGAVEPPALLETQGLKTAIAPVFHGGLSAREQRACIGLKEILRGSTIARGRKRFERWASKELEILAGHRFITVQSSWLEAHIRAANPACEIFHNDFMLRETFFSALPWSPAADPIVFCSAPYPAPFKGVHVAIRAVAILKQRFPGIQLRIAGALQKKGIRQDGYVRWLNREAERLGLASNIRWLGALSAPQLAAELRGCAAAVVPTFIEGYGLALAEAMILGVPAAVSFAGGAATLARHEESALYFPPGDAPMCAWQLERLLTDGALAQRISRQARESGLSRNDRGRIVRNQMQIYERVIAGSSSGPHPAGAEESG